MATLNRSAPFINYTATLDDGGGYGESFNVINIDLTGVQSGAGDHFDPNSPIVQIKFNGQTIFRLNPYGGVEFGEAASADHFIAQKNVRGHALIAANPGNFALLEPQTVAQLSTPAADGWGDGLIAIVNDSMQDSANGRDSAVVGGGTHNVMVRRVSGVWIVC